MLIVSDSTFAAFEGKEIDELVLQIDALLCEETDSFPRAEVQSRRTELKKMIALARQDGMQTERDISLFCVGCWTLGRDWHAELTSGQTGEWLADPQYNAESKLLHIDDMLMKKEVQQ